MRLRTGISRNVRLTRQTPCKRKRLNLLMIRAIRSGKSWRSVER